MTNRKSYSVICFSIMPFSILLSKGMYTHTLFLLRFFIFLSQTKNNDVSVKILKKHGFIQLNLFQTAFVSSSPSVQPASFNFRCCAS
ncbi:hypothetical protein NEIFLAOT_02011 [Neisseria flavescens NRL30031/H210]|uniref:Uncharacterized protein n=1 Tax=Neisseria flavescens NRL30031/H210 TaxID=546264 RepID=C0EPX0_NEIFL|nr:hypothetical protein NEIFLAOT_02011 [Neisseria flavescens NRL30031/H210]